MTLNLALGGSRTKKRQMTFLSFLSSRREWVEPCGGITQQWCEGDFVIGWCVCAVYVVVMEWGVCICVRSDVRVLSWSHVCDVGVYGAYELIYR